MPNSNVIVFEKTNRILAKVGISGGGRCNLTNSFADISDLKQAYPRGKQTDKNDFLKDSIITILFNGSRLMEFN